MSDSTTPLASLAIDEPSVAEKRRFQRYSIDVAVKVKVKTNSGISSYCYGRGGDISEGGMVIHLSHTLPHCDRPIECDAVVRHRSQYHYGLEFQGLADNDRDLLLRACRALGVVQ